MRLVVLAFGGVIAERVLTHLALEGITAVLATAPSTNPRGCAPARAMSSGKGRSNRARRRPIAVDSPPGITSPSRSSSCSTGCRRAASSPGATASLGLTDTTFVASSGNRNWIGFGEGNTNGAVGRVMMVNDPAGPAARLGSTPGVVEHGLFPPDLVTDVLVGRGESVERLSGAR